MLRGRLLGLYVGEELVHVGVVAAFTTKQRRALFAELRPLVTSFEGHPWRREEAAVGDVARARCTPRDSESSRWSTGKDLSDVLG